VIQRTNFGKDLFENLNGIDRQVKDAPHVCLFLDIDGIVPDGFGETLERLSQRPRYSVTVIDSCSLRELQRRVNIAGLTYAANGGLDIEGPGVRFTERGASQTQEAMETLAENLVDKLNGLHGVRLRNHVFTLTIVPNGNHVTAADIARRALNSAGPEFAMEDRAASIEIRPRVAWSKGLAAQWLVAASGYPDALTIYIGDDSTGDDAFQTLGAGITVKVGNPEHCAARYYLTDQEAVARFLSWLAGS